MAKGVINMTNTSNKENTVAASNLALSLASSEWIIADIRFLSAITNSFLNPHMWWYQGLDPNIGTPAFLAFHRQVQYFLQIEDLEDIKQNLREQKKRVQGVRCVYNWNRIGGIEGWMIYRCDDKTICPQAQSTVHLHCLFSLKRVLWVQDWPDCHKIIEGRHPWMWSQY
jgi:hypothetical protein